MFMVSWRALEVMRCDATECRANMVIYDVASGNATLWRALLGRLRVRAGGVRSFLTSGGCFSVCGVLASPTSSRRNLNLDRKRCQTTYQPGGGDITKIQLLELKQ